MTATETWTVDQCSKAWGVTPSTWRSYVSIGRAPNPLPGYDDQRRRRWNAAEVQNYPRPGQGQRSDLTGDRIGRLVAVARVVAESGGGYDEWSKVYQRILDGNPAAVRTMTAAVRRWAKRKTGSADVSEALREVDGLTEQIGDPGAEYLSLRLREQIILAYARHRAIDDHPVTGV